MAGDRYWEDRPLATLDRAQWESLCDGCGKCCLHKLEDDDTGEIYPTNVACRLLDRKTGQCSDYRNRFAQVPDPSAHADDIHLRLGGDGRGNCLAVPAAWMHFLRIREEVHFFPQLPPRKPLESEEK